MTIVTREFKDADIEDEIREAFRVFDKEGNGFITVSELTEVLLKLGEKLSSEECQELIQASAAEQTCKRCSEHHQTSLHVCF